MSEEFDPYYRWLGIPPEEQPPHHYRLLGVKSFETDTEVINNAADRQMNYVRTFQMGKRGPMAEEILNKIAVAKVCLLSATQKAEYDRRLQQDSGEKEGGEKEEGEEQNPAAASPTQTPTPPPAPEAPPQRVIVEAGSAGRPGRQRIASSKPNKRSWQKISTIVAVTIIIVLVLANGAIWVYNQFVKGGDANAAQNNTPQDSGGQQQLPAAPPGEMPQGANILENVDLSAAAISGDWTHDADDASAILSDRSRYAKLHLAEELPSSYTLALAIRRISGNDAFAVTLPVGGSRCTIVLDSGQNSNRSSGIELIKGAKFNDANNGTTHVLPRGDRLLATNADVVVRCHVRPNSVQVRCNGETIIDWTGDAADLSVWHSWDAPQKDGILLGTNRSTFRIEKIVIVRE